jgi:zinc D-Ala-D-Ala carboxypeptidase
VRAVAFRRTLICGAACAVILLQAPSATAFEFSRTLSEGATGKDVKALQIRIAGWYPATDQTYFPIDGSYGAPTAEAVAAFEEFYGLPVDGVADPEVFAILDELEDDDGSTAHFEWSEFTQHESSNCSAKANAYAGTFDGGMSSPHRVASNVKRMMWRLEAIRAKGGDNPVAINSGFRSVAYNSCIGGASASQHMYGTAADNRVAGITNRKARSLAKASQVHGIGCYSSLSHNHFDLRIDNPDLASSQFWWWPEQDSANRDLDEVGHPCWGEGKKGRASAYGSLSKALSDLGSLVPTAEELEQFEAAGEPSDLKGAD